jgi:hypothetical protein
MNPDDLKAFLDGELKPMEAEVYASRLREKPENQAVADDFRTISQVLRTESIAPSAEGLQATLVRLRATPPARPRWIPAFAGGFALAAALALVVVVPLVINRSGSEGTVALSKAAVPTAALSQAAPMEMDQVSKSAPVQSPAAEKKAVVTEPVKPKDDMNLSAKVGPNQNVPMLPGVSPLPGQVSGFAGSEQSPSGPVGEATIRNLVASMKGKVVKVTASTNPGKSVAKTFLVSVPGDVAEELVSRLREALSVVAEVGDPYEIPDKASLSNQAPAAAPEAKAADTAEKVRASREEADDVTVADMQAQMLILRRRKSELLAQFFEDAKPVQEVIGQIADLQKKIDAKIAAEKKGAKKPKYVQIVIGGW